MKYHFTTSHLSEWPSLISLQTTNAGKGVKKKGTLPYCWWESTSVQTLRRPVWRLLNKLREELPWGFPGGSVENNSPTSAGDLGSTPGSERFPGEVNDNPL